MQAPSFSVVLIARNEAKTLPRMLGSLAEFQQRGGSVVLMDTGSTDGTQDVARSAGCIVHEVGERFLHTLTQKEAQAINGAFHAPGEALIVKRGDKFFEFAAARNHAASLAPTDYIVMPDCDEVYLRFDVDAIDALFKSADQLEHNYIYTRDKNGKPGLEFRYAKLYDRRKLEWVGNIHEVLHPIAGAQVVKVYTTQVLLEHKQNHETDRSGYIRSLAYDCWRHPENDRNAHYLGREFFYYGMHESAIKQLRRHVAMQKWPAERSESMCYIGRALIAQGKPQEGIAALAEAYHIEPQRREPLMHIAEYYYREKQPQPAAAYAMAALQVPRKQGLYMDHIPHYTYMPHEVLYWALWHLGRKAEAREHWRLCREHVPESEKYAQDEQWFAS